MIKTAMDQGFVDQCIRRGIQDPGQIQMLAKVATDQVNQAEMQKRAAPWYQRLLAQAHAYPEIAGALAGGGVGAGLGGLATGTWGGAGAGAIGGGLLGAGGANLLQQQRTLAATAESQTNWEQDQRNELRARIQKLEDLLNESK